MPDVGNEALPASLGTTPANQPTLRACSQCRFLCLLQHGATAIQCLSISYVARARVGRQQQKSQDVDNSLLLVI